MTKLKQKRKRAKKTKIRLWVKVFLTVAVISVILLLIWEGKPVYEDIAYPREYADIVHKYAKEYDIDENLIFAVIKTESGFETDAVSENNAKGLMQITEETFDWISTKLDTTDTYSHDDLHNPEIGIKYGVFFLNFLTEEFGNNTSVLAAYHAGRGAVNDWLDNTQYSADGENLSTIPYSDTAHYVQKVLGNYENYSKIYKK